MKIACNICLDESKNAKYKCPGCEIRFCSVQCSKTHKEATKCSGERDKTKYVPKSEFNDNTFMSDFCLLQNISRTLDDENSYSSNTISTIRSKLNGRQKLLHAAAKKRGIDLRIMSGLERSRMNPSYFNKKIGKIIWKVEFEIHAGDLISDVLFIRGVSEDKTMAEIFAQVMDSDRYGKSEISLLTKSLMSAGKEQDSNFIFVRRKEGAEGSAAQSVYYRHTPSDTLHDCLERTVIYEYPRFHVYFFESQVINFSFQSKSKDIKIHLN